MPPALGKKSQRGYNPDKNRDGSRSGWDEKISSVPTLRCDRGCYPRFRDINWGKLRFSSTFPDALGQSPQILRQKVRNNWGKSWLSPNFSLKVGDNRDVINLPWLLGYKIEEFPTISNFFLTVEMVLTPRSWHNFGIEEFFLSQSQFLLRSGRACPIHLAQIPELPCQDHFACLM